MYLQMNTHNGRDGGRAVCYDQPFYKLRPTFDNHLSTLSLQQTNTNKVHAMCNQTQFKSLKIILFAYAQMF